MKDKTLFLFINLLSFDLERFAIAYFLGNLMKLWKGMETWETLGFTIQSINYIAYCIELTIIDFTLENVLLTMKKVYR